MEKLFERIKELRLAKNLTQKELAERIGVAKSMISMWESGINEPKANYIVKLAKELEVSSDYLLGIIDDYI